MIWLLVLHLLFSLGLFVSVMAYADKGDWTYRTNKARVLGECMIWPTWFLRSRSKS